MRAVWLADVLTDAGLKVIPRLGWQTRGRNDFTPKGIILHHTVTPPTRPDAVVDDFLINGRSDLSGPLANYSTNRDGSISLIAAGTANHGGIGEWLGVSGNRNWFGDEMKNLGKSEPWSGVQLEAARRAAAAICLHLGVESEWVCGHKEYALPAGRKPDPHTLNMNTERALIKAIMEANMLTPQEEKFVKDLHQAIVVDGGSNAAGWGSQSLADVRERNTEGPWAKASHTHAGTGGLTEEQVKAIVNGSTIHAPD